MMLHYIFFFRRKNVVTEISPIEWRRSEPLRQRPLRAHLIDLAETSLLWINLAETSLHWVSRPSKSVASPRYGHRTKKFSEPLESL